MFYSIYKLMHLTVKIYFFGAVNSFYLKLETKFRINSRPTTLTRFIWNDSLKVWQIFSKVIIMNSKMLRAIQANNYLLSYTLNCEFLSLDSLAAKHNRTLHENWQKNLIKFSYYIFN
jgi:hypothetical protein